MCRTVFCCDQTVMAIFDALKDSVFVVTPVWPTNTVDARQALDGARARIKDVVDNLNRATCPCPVQTWTHRRDPLEPDSNMTREGFHDVVRACVDYINAGDAFQIVPSQRFSVPFTLPSFAFYRSLRRLNPSPYLFYLNFGDFQVVGSSPEILVRVRDGRVTLRPLAGTRKRGATPAEDKALAEDLLSDPKELAEHLMLLDLGRNDVGRVAKLGTVNADGKIHRRILFPTSCTSRRMSKEIWPTIKMRWTHYLQGSLPATVSGAPKIRAMEIIDELEPVRRGIYAGCIGYFGANGDMDTAIALRTGVIKGGRLHVQAGCGVVTDSDPEMEYQETINKARALIRAAEDASQFRDS